MLSSMTGYGRSQQIIEDLDITVEVKSVNHRFFEFSSRLPRGMWYLEEKLKVLFHGQISRGKVDVNVAISNLGGDAKVEINLLLAESYLNELRKVGQILGLSDNLNLSEVARFHDIYISRASSPDEESVTKSVESIATKALEALLSTKRREGEGLGSDIENRLKTIEELTEDVERRNPQAVEQHRLRLTAKLEEILAGKNIDESRIITESAIFAEKTAADEETVRLRSHILQMRSFLSEGGAIGRKLDFLVQEMNREANTIGSKAPDSGTQHIVVELKSEIEKIREQIQNIE